MAQEQYYGTGRRKTSTARVFIKNGKGDITVNRKLANTARNAPVPMRSISDFSTLSNIFNPY